MKLIFLIVAVLLMPQFTWAGEWQVYRSIDRMTDKESVSVSTSDAKGYTLILYLKKDKPFQDQLYLGFIISDASPDVIDPQQVGMIRIDNDPAIDMHEKILFQEKYTEFGLIAYAKRKSIALRIAYAPRRKNSDLVSPIGQIAKFADAAKTLVRYYIQGGAYHDVEFDATGIRKALNSAYGLPIETSSADKKSMDVWNAAYVPCVGYDTDTACRSVQQVCRPILYNVPAKELTVCINQYLGRRWKPPS